MWTCAECRSPMEAPPKHYGLCKTCYFKPHIANKYRRPQPTAKVEEPVTPDAIVGVPATAQADMPVDLVFDKVCVADLDDTTKNDVLKNGWQVTINRNLVPEEAAYYFTDPKFIGSEYSHVGVETGRKPQDELDRAVPTDKPVHVVEMEDAITKAMATYAQRQEPVRMPDMNQLWTDLQHLKKMFVRFLELQKIELPPEFVKAFLNPQEAQEKARLERLDQEATAYWALQEKACREHAAHQKEMWPQNAAASPAKVDWTTFDPTVFAHCKKCRFRINVAQYAYLHTMEYAFTELWGPCLGVTCNGEVRHWEIEAAHPIGTFQSYPPKSEMKAALQNCERAYITGGQVRDKLDEHMTKLLLAEGIPANMIEEEVRRQMEEQRFEAEQQAKLQEEMDQAAVMEQQADEPQVVEQKPPLRPGAGYDGWMSGTSRL